MVLVQMGTRNCGRKAFIPRLEHLLLRFTPLRISVESWHHPALASHFQLPFLLSMFGAGRPPSFLFPSRPPSLVPRRPRPAPASITPYCSLPFLSRSFSGECPDFVSWRTPCVASDPVPRRLSTRHPIFFVFRFVCHTYHIIAC